MRLITLAVNRIRIAADYYEMLDVPRDASSEMIQAQYKCMYLLEESQPHAYNIYIVAIMQMLHMSSNNGVFPSSMPSVVKKVAQAYSFLSDPKKRIEYGITFKMKRTDCNLCEFSIMLINY
jgi:hypothetical protein